MLSLRRGRSRAAPRVFACRRPGLLPIDRPVGRLRRPTDRTSCSSRGRQRPLISFELFPAKDEVQQRQLWQTVRELEALGPDFVSVTYGASGSTRDRTILATQAIAQHTTLRTDGAPDLRQPVEARSCAR